MGVGCEEFRDICMGTGKHASSDGLLPQLKEIFEGERGARPRISNWVFQCDGATCQSINPKPNTAGYATRCAILSIAPNLLEGWPASSPDLSPIENAFSKCEELLWSEYEWSDFASFQKALRAAWAKLTSGPKGLAYCKSLVGSFEKRRQKCIAANGGRIKY